MERIKKAVKKAREERRQQGQSDSLDQAESQDTQVSAAEQNDPTNTATPTDIEYTCTRKIQVPDEVLRSNQILTDTSDEAYTSSYKMLRTHVLQQMRENNWNTLAITSAIAGEGKTLTSINLAISLAREVNNTVLLVDLDLRRPTIHKYLGFQPTCGLSDYLKHGTSLEDILIHPCIDRLVILPGRSPIAHSSEMLSTPKMLDLVNELKTRYPNRYILFDMPPLLAADDALAFSPYVDAAMLVVEYGRTKEEDLKHANSLLDKTNVIGAVLNKSTKDGPQYAYY